MNAPQPQGYLALPPAGDGPGVLVLHAWWGLNDTIKAFCDRLAEAGFVACAPDLYHGKIADTIADAKTFAGELDDDQARVDIADAVATLRQRAGTQSLAVIGFSLGVYYALELSTTDPDQVRAVVVFYGTGPGDFSRAKAEYLGHFAEDDPYEPQNYVEELETSLREAGRPVQFHTYAGVGHWFFEPDRADAYNPEAASLAWERTLAFLKDAFSLQG